MGVESKVEYLIVDTSAFIKNAALQDIGNQIITEPSVVNEIKNKRQLRRLVVLPYDLEVKEPFPEDIKFVTEFSKKTGDYASLSATDIKVIALTYRYEKEKVGTDHLRIEPDVKKEVIDSSVHRPEDHPKNVAGFYLPEGKKNYEESDSNENLDIEEDINAQCIDELTVTNTNSDISSIDDQNLKTINDVCKRKDLISDYDTAKPEEDTKNVQKLSKMFENLDCNPADLKVDLEDKLSIDDILKPLKDHDKNYSLEDEYQSDNEDDDGWITPKNITNMKKKMDSDVVRDKPAIVACLTMDYAMQNVMMQIGLSIASLEGKVIKQMRTFILRCYTCFKTTGVVTKIFCPHCGNKTLKKVAVSLDDEGKQQIHINFRKPLTSKGKKYSLPTFQGGKHACNPVLFEDQPIPDQRQTKLGRIKNDPLNEDYIAGYSPFVMRDVNSRAAMLGIKGDQPVKYWMRKNPNEVRKRKK